MHYQSCWDSLDTFTELKNTNDKHFQTKKQFCAVFHPQRTAVFPGHSCFFPFAWIPQKVHKHNLDAICVSFLLPNVPKGFPFQACLNFCEHFEMMVNLRGHKGNRNFQKCVWQMQRRVKLGWLSSNWTHRVSVWHLKTQLVTQSLSVCQGTDVVQLPV